MKKLLLLGSTLLFTLSALSQSKQIRNNTTHLVDVGGQMLQKYRLRHAPVETSPFYPPVSTVPANSVKLQLQLRTRSASASSFSTLTSWSRFTGSENIYGMLISTSRPLQYNDELGLISFVHRKSHTYITNPAPMATASTGVIVADITADWGQNWDSTALWSNNAEWARYPQGGIYNTTPTNTNPAQAYIIGTGPVTNASQNWQGNWFASKQLDAVHGPNYNNTPSLVNGAQQFIANSGNDVTGPTGKVDYARLDFAYTDDGQVHALGDIMKDANGTSFAAQLTRGARILSATFNAATGTFSWSGDSIIPPVVIGSDGHPMLLGDAHMAWKEDGSVGYVFFIGCRSGATLSNVGNQPIVYMKTAQTVTWTPVAGIDFNSQAMAGVKGHVPPVNETSSFRIPFFNVDEGIDGIVDMNGNLHIMSTVKGSAGSNVDSLNLSFSEDNFDGETYTYAHSPGKRPYIYDFVFSKASATGIANPWSVITVDSMGSEAPGWAQESDPGYVNNPWDIDPTSSSKVAIEARLQMSRTPDGKNIIYTWAESDTITSADGVKWNYNPNLKARLLTVSSNSMTLNDGEVSITDPPSLNDANTEVRAFAYNHYASPKCRQLATTPNVTTILLPMTVSNNLSLHQLEPVNHYFASAVLTYTNSIIDGIATQMLNSTKEISIYPNPAAGSAVVALDLKSHAAVSISINNLVGQQVRTFDVQAQAGQNQIQIDLSGLQKGIYLVHVNSGTNAGTKKLIIE